MTFECTLSVSGIRPEVSNQAFLRSYQDTSKPKYYKKYEKRIESFFKDKLIQNMSQNQIPQSLEQSFFVDFKNDGIYFNSNSQKALKYEFGAGNMPPKRFIEPALIDTANEVSDIMITDALDLYNRYSRFV
jgi:hypothetical protein